MTFETRGFDSPTKSHNVPAVRGRPSLRQQSSIASLIVSP